MDSSTMYQIRVKGHLDDALATWFEGFALSNQEAGDALLTGHIQDQAALHGILNRISNLGLTLISVNTVHEEEAKNEEGDENE
jgi:hypothetical protein